MLISKHTQISLNTGYCLSKVPARSRLLEILTAMVNVKRGQSLFRWRSKSAAYLYTKSKQPPIHLQYFLCTIGSYVLRIMRTCNFALSIQTTVYTNILVKLIFLKILPLVCSCKKAKLKSSCLASTNHLQRRQRQLSIN